MPACSNFVPDSDTQAGNVVGLQGRGRASGRVVGLWRLAGVDAQCCWGSVIPTRTALGTIGYTLTLVHTDEDTAECDKTLKNVIYREHTVMLVGARAVQ